MTRNTPAPTHSSTAPQRVLAVLSAIVFAYTAASGQQPARHTPAPIERQAPSSNQHPNAGGYSTPGHLGPAHQHLSEWMDSHRNLPLDQQQRALESEPGFRQLQPDEQQRMHERLTQLNAMPPAQRERTIARTEAMERLTQPQRVQVRSALGDLGGLPEDRRRLVARTFRALRDLPEPQRQAYLNSPQYRGQFSDHERATLNNLFVVAPYLPPPVPPGPQAPR